MKMPTRILQFLLFCSVLVLIVTPFNKASSQTETPDRQQLASTILNDQDLQHVLQRAKSILKGKLNAGSGYGEVWIRDLNTFIEMALQVQDQSQIRDALTAFFHFQGADGGIIDGYIPAEEAHVGYDYILSATRPNLRGHKNTVETDQEASLIQAIYKYVSVTGDSAMLVQEINGETVLQRMGEALSFLIDKRFVNQYGLIWGATTVDWGDVQPEHSWGVRLDENSHRSIDIYDNAMFLVAVDDYIKLGGDQEQKWRQMAQAVRANVRTYLWDKQRHKFRPHIYLEEGSPFPDWFDEQRIYYHGGTVVAIEAGLLSKEEIRLTLNDMINNKKFSGAASIGLTIFPVYPAGFFKNPGMKPWSYQNGGDWTWFGGRMIQQLVANGFVAEAYEEVLPMIERVQKNDGFFEWYTVQNEPKGSGVFRGSAGVLGKAILMLQQWAEENMP